jgi:hypothetical protein
MKRINFILCLWVIFALLDPDPKPDTDPDPHHWKRSSVNYAKSMSIHERLEKKRRSSKPS